MNKYIFTFGGGQLYAGFYQPIYADCPNVARAKMVDLHGVKWAFQYTEAEWKQAEIDMQNYCTPEQPLEAVYCDN